MIRLSSNVMPGLDKCASAVSLMYTDLLIRDNIKAYNHILIKHVPETEAAGQVIALGNKEVGVRVHYRTPDNIVSQDDDAIQLAVLEIIHAGLVILAQEKHKLELDYLNRIKEEILQLNFEFWVEGKHFIHKKDNLLTATVIANLKMKQFDIYLQIAYEGKIKWKVLIYEGVNTASYFYDLFSVGKWTKNEFILSGKKSEIEFHLNLEDGSLKLANISPSASESPHFNFYKISIDKEKAVKDYLGTLDPALANTMMDHLKSIDPKK